MKRLRPAALSFAIGPMAIAISFFNIKHSACSAIGMTPQAEALIETADHLHVMGSALFSESIVEAIHEATIRIKAKGGTVSFDPNIRKEMLELPGMREALLHALDNCDLFMPSGGGNLPLYPGDR
jgi:sugar/nucleoside kinase (ribokinase family)